MTAKRAQDYPVVGGNLSIGSGIWTSDLLLETETAPAVGTTVSLVVGSTARVGTVVAAGEPYQQARCRVIGGAAKLKTVLEPSDYRGYLASDVLADILRSAGETVGDVSLLDAYLSHWSRLKEPAYRAVQRLLRVAGMGADYGVQTAWSDLTWRVGRDGKINLYRDSWPTLTDDDEGIKVLGYSPTENVAELAVEDSQVEPGVSLDVFDVVRKVDRVTYTLSDDRFRATCYLRRE